MADDIGIIIRPSAKILVFDMFVITVSAIQVISCFPDGRVIAKQGVGIGSG